MESISLNESLFQIHASDFGSQAVSVESRSSSELSGTALMASVLCWTTGIHHFGCESNPRLLDCFVSSPLGLWDLSLRRHAIVNNVVDELRLGKLHCLLCRLCVFMWSQLHHCDGLFQNRQWHLHLDDLFSHIDDLFDDSLWDMLLARELRLRTPFFAGVVNVTQRETRLTFLYRIRSVFFTKSFGRRVSESSDWFSFR